MKRNFLLIITLLSFVFFKTQTLEWEKTFGGTKVEEYVKHVDSPDGNYVFTGSTLSNDVDIAVNYGLKDIFLTKIDTNGNYLWKKNIGGNNDDVPLDIINSNDGGMILVSQSKSTTNSFMINRGNNDLWVTKLDVSGNPVWNLPIAGSGDESGARIIPITNGYILTVNTNSNDFDFTHATSTGKDVWIIRLDEAGNIVWKKALEGSLDETSTTLKKIDNSNFLLLVNSVSANGDYSANTVPNVNKGFLFKLDIDGNILINSKIESSDIQKPNFINDVKVVNDGYFIGGRESINQVAPDGTILTTYYDALFVKLSGSGTILWKKNYSVLAQFNQVFFTEETSDNNPLFLGTTSSSGYLVPWMIKMDNAGNTLKYTEMSSRPYAVKKLPNGNFVLNGIVITTSPISTGNNIFTLSFINGIGTTVMSNHQLKLGQFANSKNTISSITNDGKVIGFWNDEHNPTNRVTDVWFFKFQIPANVLSVNNILGNMKGISVYPNPTNDYIKISEKMDELVVYDLSGRMILSVENTDTVDLRGVNTGIYILKAKNKKETRSFKIEKK
ncbi:T9SS type A sorting domain-containing protein [Chryseobacterium limigenitum]|uniref:Por secretion system C-terminal sorting domain-containing protein n=1 Tax=Chryseobacterium limigenitum TaxID=1612149 RepID=A0A1K2IWP2_9FLAO|nr:T9SS type A sorting domain-containing protein [Chryseobacterium limigenitum]SFZ96179.1 Por secretion system C-terminal sorting domain-containing protein [Chryseobacterium limigenitum]